MCLLLVETINKIVQLNFYVDAFVFDTIGSLEIIRICTFIRETFVSKLDYIEEIRLYVASVIHCICTYSVQNKKYIQGSFT